METSYLVSSSSPFSFSCPQPPQFYSLHRTALTGFLPPALRLLSSVWAPLTGAFAGLLTALWLQPLSLLLAFSLW
ncbi:unnamed protein product [Rangifer tarandus platyrhynchus]|uniref:Uncharacterized protein n=1 Tax=Rangifer tarandus platyrhynchus TaxID=3082113 RepID=A0ABN8XS88_RANTA|nr:unnamed protein product [Rangifer tarandus platyrhynchus]